MISAPDAISRNCQEAKRRENSPRLWEVIAWPRSCRLKSGTALPCRTSSPESGSLCGVARWQRKKRANAPALLNNLLLHLLQNIVFAIASESCRAPLVPTVCRIVPAKVSAKKRAEAPALLSQPFVALAAKYCYRDPIGKLPRVAGPDCWLNHSGWRSAKKKRMPLLHMNNLLLHLLQNIVIAIASES